MEESIQEQFRIPEGVDPDLAPLIPSYLMRRKEDLEDMKNNLASLNFIELKKIAHKMKGTGTAYGFPEITELSKQLEKASDEQSPEEAGQIISSIESYVKSFEL